MRTLLNIGDWAYDPVRKCQVRILERTELWGYVTCTVYAPALNRTYSVSEKQLVDPAEATRHEDYIRFIALHAWIRNEWAEGIVSPIGGKILPLPHQLYALQRVLDSSRVRFLFADEVGLGKTIEAGLVIRELKARALIKRILIVCPKSLITQWHAEMKDKFGETFHIILPEDVDTIRRLYGDGEVYSRFQQVICSLDAIKPLEKRAGWSREKIDLYNRERIEAVLDTGWDLVIIDEAHRVAGSSSRVARYKLGARLAKAAPYLLLLTATPHSGKSEPFLRLMRMLDEKAFPDVRAIVKEQVAPYLVRTEKRAVVDHEGNRLFKDRITRVLEIEWEERHELQKKLYEQVTFYVKSGYQLAQRVKKTHIGFLMVLMQRLATSSTAAIRDSLERRIAVLESQEASQPSFSETFDWLNLEADDALDEAIRLKASGWKNELELLKRLLVTAKQAEFQYADAKAERLLEELDRIRSLKIADKVIVFTEFVATQMYLRDFLEKHGFAVSILNGSMDLEQRNAVLREFKESKNVLVSTDAGGEGLNLQFANVVVNYDLPWNPMKIEQRIGRVDRIGQTRDVLVYNFILSDTVENRVRKVLEEKLLNIFVELGIQKLQDVLDSEWAEIDFTEAYIRSIADPEHIDEHVKRVERDLREQAEQALRIRDIVTDDHSMDIEQALKLARQDVSDMAVRMLDAYQKWNGIGELPLPESLDLIDPKIRSLLEQDFYINDHGLLMSVHLPGLPYEPGIWSLWELKLTNDAKDRRVFPLFMNHHGVFRPASAMRIWDELLAPDREIHLGDSVHLSTEQRERLFEGARTAAHDLFLELKSVREQRIREEENRALFALQLRKEAVEHIGLDTVKRKRKQELLEEEAKIKTEISEKQMLTPMLKPVFLINLE